MISENRQMRMRHGLTRSSDVVRMVQVFPAELLLELVERSLVSNKRVKVRDDGLDVCGAVGGHVLADGREVLVEVARGWSDSVGSLACGDDQERKATPTLESR